MHVYVSVTRPSAGTHSFSFYEMLHFPYLGGATAESDEAALNPLRLSGIEVHFADV